MYHLSTTEDISFLAHAEIIQVCVGANEVILNFDGSIRITILADFSVTMNNGMVVRYDDPRKGAAALIELLHDSIVTAEATINGDLRMQFASGTELVVFDSSSEYESFWIKEPNKEIIV